MLAYGFSSLWKRLRPSSESVVSPALVEDLSPDIRPCLLLDVRGEQVQRLRRHLQAPERVSVGGLERPWRVEKDSNHLTGQLVVDRDYQSLLVERAGPVLLLTGTSRALDSSQTRLVQFELLSLDRENKIHRSYSRLKTRVGPGLFSPVLATEQWLGS